ncbi:MAG: hypothetical protein Q3M24_17620 [Candidatus Electrothrix aestuarii]|uniref:Uncharacterized protein n=1 Tax=Candidatus Electrothrix aestuarii TaxID=3062594 RepID=A0AAU8LTB6_9BACT|nr:hypothetical protein [Candidatus Electrothrix aestuarii]
MQFVIKNRKSANVKMYCLVILVAGSGLFCNVPKVGAELAEKIETCLQEETNKHWQELEQAGKLSSLKSPSRELSLCCEEKAGADKDACYETRKQTIADMATHNSFYTESSKVVATCCARYCLDTVLPERVAAEGSTMPEACARCRIQCVSDASHFAQTLHGDLVFNYGCQSSPTP